MKITKNITLITMLGTILTLTSATIFAAVEPIPGPTITVRQNLPIRNLEQLWIWTLNNQVRKGYVGVGGDNIAERSGNTNFVPVPFPSSVGGGADYWKITETLNAVVFDFLIAGTNNLYAFISLQDEKGRELFYGSTSAKVTRSSTTGAPYRITTDKISPRIGDIVWLPYHGAYYARFQQKTKEGWNIGQSFDIPVIDGEIRFPVGLVGNVQEYMEKGSSEESYGELSVYVQNGNGYREDTFRNGTYVIPQRVVGSVNVSFDGKIQNLGFNPERIQASAWETNPEFVIAFALTEEREIKIFPSVGKRLNSAGQEEIVTHAFKGQLLDGYGNRIEEFTTTSNGISGRFWKGRYYIILDDWEDPDFGRNYREYHYVPRRIEPTTPSGGGGGGKGI